ncbi:hypothetical protein pipiens_003768, partial [Culex pipiens pipiens]
AAQSTDSTSYATVVDKGTAIINSLLPNFVATNLNQLNQAASESKQKELDTTAQQPSCSHLSTATDGVEQSSSSTITPAVAEDDSMSDETIVPVANETELMDQDLQQRGYDDSAQFDATSPLFFGKQIPVKECMEDKFFEEIEKLDFENDPESQRLYIKNWVENTTHGEITDLLIPGSITKNTKLAIANAAYFKGTWQSKFKPEETKKEIFYVSNERHEFVDMMHVEGTFNHAANEKLGCHILELPYTGQDEASRVSMFVFLPPTESNALTNSLPASPHKLVDSWVMVTFELKFSNVCRNNDGKHSSVMRPDSKQECLLKGFDLDSRKPEQWIGDS